MKRTLLTVTLLTAMIAGGGWVAAETATAPKPAKTTPAPGRPGAMGPGGMGMDMMGGGGMGMGMMGGGMGMGMMGPDTKIEVKNVDKGVTMTFTSTDPAKVVRLQKMAEAMRLMHEAMTP